jgi:hypothetical protein
MGLDSRHPPSIPPLHGPARLAISNAYYEVLVHSRGRLVRITRSPVPFPSQAAVEAACLPIHQLLDELERPKVCLLIDSRNAPRRNDPEYEHWFMPHRTRMVAGLRRAAIVLASAVGKLQAERVLRSDKSPESVRAFTDEAAALSYLQDAEAASSPSPSR